VTPGTAPTLQDLLRFKLLMMLLLPTLGKPYSVKETNNFLLTVFIYNFKINKKNLPTTPTRIAVLIPLLRA